MYINIDEYLESLSNQFSVVGTNNLDALSNIYGDIPCSDFYDINVSIAQNMLNISGSKMLSNKMYLLPFNIANHNLIANKSVLLSYSRDHLSAVTITSLVNLLQSSLTYLEDLSQRISTLHESLSYFGLVYTTNTIVLQKNFEATTSKQDYIVHGYTPIGVIQEDPNLITGISTTEFDGSVTGFKVISKLSNPQSESLGLHKYYVKLVDSNVRFSFDRIIYSKLILPEGITVLNYNNVKVKYALTVLKGFYLQKCSSLVNSITNALTYLSDIVI